MSASTATQRWAWPAACVGAGAAAFAVLRQVNPYDPQSLLPGCPSRWLTGLFCPGCGSTRCLHALAHGDIATAMAMNPLLVISLPILALMLLHHAELLPRRGQWLSHQLASARGWLWVLLGYGILRNLPWWPFSWLAPG